MFLLQKKMNIRDMINHKPLIDINDTFYLVKIKAKPLFQVVAKIACCTVYKTVYSIADFDTMMSYATCITVL